MDCGIRSGLMVRDGVAQSINTQLENRIDELGLRMFAFVGASLVENLIDHPDFDQDMAPDGHVRLARGPGQIIGHARLFVEVGDSQLLGNGSDPKTLLGRTAQWLTCGIAENICVLIVKLYGDVEEDPSSDGMTMALINREGVQWICSWGDTSKDGTVGVFRQFSKDFWVAQQGGTAAPATPAVETADGSRCHISLTNHFPVLNQESLQRFVSLLEQEVQGRVLGGAPPAFNRTLEALTQQAGLLEEGNPTAIFRDDATIAINGDRIYENYQDLLAERRAEQSVKRQKPNP